MNVRSDKCRARLSGLAAWAERLLLLVAMMAPTAAHAAEPAPTAAAAPTNSTAGTNPPAAVPAPPAANGAGRPAEATSAQPADSVTLLNNAYGPVKVKLGELQERLDKMPTNVLTPADLSKAINDSLKTGRGTPWWAMAILGLLVANLAAVFWRSSGGGSGASAAERVAKDLQTAVQSLQTAAKGDGWQKASQQAEELLRQIQQQSAGAQQAATEKTEALFHRAEEQTAGAQQKLAAVLEDFRTQAESLAGKLSAPQLEPLAQQTAKVTSTLGALTEQLDQLKTAFNDFGGSFMEFKKQWHEKRHLDSLEEDTHKKLAALKHQEQQLAREREAFKKEQAEAHQRQTDSQNAIWPPAFRDGGALANWRQTITDGVAQGDLLATSLLVALLRFEVLSRQPEPALAPVAEALHNLSLEAHRFWKGKPGDFNDTAVRWRDEFNAAIGRCHLPLEIQAIYPQDRFDTNYMVVAEGSSGSRLYVKEPLSWVILDKTNPERSKVLHHGVVLTV